MPLNLVTGATGLLGSQLVERLLARGERVRAAVRSVPAPPFLQELDVELVTCDLRDPSAVQRAMSGVELVYHCAAPVGDWGRWEAFYSGTVETTRHVMEACRRCGVGRLLHVSSIAAYGRLRSHGGQAVFDEETPLGRRFRWWDYYGRAKLQAEREVRSLGSLVTVVRPTWIYGPRDRVILPRLIRALRNRRVALIGSGDNLLNMVYSQDVAEGAILAATSPEAAGETFNLVSEGELTQRQFFALLSDLCGAPPVRYRVPFRLADAVGFVSELAGRATGRTTAPHVSRSGIALLSRPSFFSSEKARSRLGWRQQTDMQEGLRRAVEWQKTSGLVDWPTAEPGTIGERIKGV
jgi:nucleoside-diphosphate-sugar epimerase